jgi:hypothetical protein
MLGTANTELPRMTVPGPDRPSDELKQTGRKEAPLDLVPGLAEDFVAAGAAFLAACSGNALLKFQGRMPEPSTPRGSRFPP